MADQPFPYPAPNLHPANLNGVPKAAYDSLLDVGVLVPFPIIGSCLGHACSEVAGQVDDGDLEAFTDNTFKMMALFLTGLFRVLSNGFNYPPEAAAKILLGVAIAFKGRALTVDNRTDALKEAANWNDGPLFWLNVADSTVQCIPPFYLEQQGAGEEERKDSPFPGSAAGFKVVNPTHGKPTQH